MWDAEELARDLVFHCGNSRGPIKAKRNPQTLIILELISTESADG